MKPCSENGVVNLVAMRVQNGLAARLPKSRRSCSPRRFRSVPFGRNAHWCGCNAKHGGTDQPTAPEGGRSITKRKRLALQGLALRRSALRNFALQNFASQVRGVSRYDHADEV